MKYSICYCLLLTAYCILGFTQTPETLWTRTYGYSDDDVGYDVKQTSDGGYIIVGSANFDIYEEDVYLIKTDVNGDTVWTETYGWFDSYSHAHEVQQTFEGGYVIAVELNTLMPGVWWDVWIIKTDASGTMLWQQFYGMDHNQGAFSIQQTADSGYIVAGYTCSGWQPDSLDIWLLKTDAYGDTVWTKTYGGSSNDVAYAVEQTADGGYILAGNTFSFGVGTPDFSNIYLIKTDSLGDTTWTKTYGGFGSDSAYSVLQTSDSGYVVAGYTNSFGAGGFDVYLIRTDANGDTVWTQTYGTSNDEIGRAIDLTHDGGFVVAGDDSDVLIIKTDSLGNEQWTKRVGGVELEYGWSVQQISDKGYIVAGATESFGAGGSDVYLVRLASDLGVEEQEAHYSEKAYYGATIISGPIHLPAERMCRMFDITGREVTTYDAKPGVYFIEIDGQIVQKIIKIK